MAGCCECGNEPSGSIKDGEFLDWLRDCQLFRNDSGAWSLLVCWLVGWLVDWLVGWLVGQLPSYLRGWLVGWLFDGLVGWLVSYLVI